MALADKKFDDVHDKTGSDKNKLKDEFDAGYLSKIADIPDKEPALSALVYQIGLMQEEFNEIRRYLGAEVGDGAKGDTGAKGAKGATGATGAAGAKGDKGDTGAAGADGTTPTMTSLSGSSLPTSSKGLAKGKLYNDRGTVKVA
jgi:hypothetical protein